MATYSQKELRPGSFRGIKFHTSQTSLTVGRRTQVFEYPQRDLPFVEDLGRKARTISFTAFVSGRDYIALMNLLIEALEKEGPGELVHPWLGTMRVVAQAANKITYSSKLRVASVELTFVEAGESKYPSGEMDTAHVSQVIANLMKKNAISSFALSFNLAGVQDFVSAAVSGDLSKILQLDGLQTVAKMFEFSDSIANMAADVISLVSLDPKVLANTLANSLGLGGYVTTVNNWRKVARQLSRLSNDKSLTEASGVKFVSATTTELIVKNKAAIQALVRQVTISNAIGASTLVGTSLDRGDKLESSEVMAYDEMISVRDEVLAAIDAEMERVTDDAMYETLEQARSAVWADVTERAENNARLVNFTPPEVMPALVLAYDYYGDATREAEIVERNNVRHAGFVPAVPLKILSQ